MKPWPIKKLGEVANLKRGPFGGSLKKDIFVSDGYKVYEQKNAIYNDFSLGNYFITKDKYKQMEGFAVKPGDLIVSCSGTIGQVAIVPPNIQPGIINQALLKISPFPEITSSEYLAYTISNDDMQKKMFGGARGSSIKNVASVKEIKNTLLSLPTFNQQKKIVERLDAIRKAQELCDQQIQKTEELFESILEKELKNLDKDKIVKLDDVCTKITDGVHKTPKYVAQGIPFISVNNISSGKVNFSKTKFITQEEHEELTKRCKPEKGDVLYSKVGTVGIADVIEVDFVFDIFVQLALIKVNKNKLNPYYLKSALNWNKIKQSVLSKLSGGTMKYIGISEIKKIEIPLPSLIEQLKIVEKLEAVQNYKRLLQKERGLLRELFDSVLDKSMKGELDD